MGNVVPDGEWIYGMQLPVQTLTRTLREPWEDTATVDDLVAIARHADATGHGFIGVCDHVAIPDNDSARHMTTTWYDTVATLAFLAAHTSQVRLLSIVWVAGYRHPLQTAKSFGTIDHLSGGRAILGVGAGHVEAEFEALGIEFPTRGQRLDETLRALREVWRSGYVSFHGDFYEYENVGVAPAPAAGNLPIWVGGSGPAAWRRVGRFGDGYIPMGAPLEEYGRIRSTIAAATEAAGRAGAAFDLGYGVPFLYIGTPPDDLGGYPPVSGSPEQIAERFRGARAAGCNVMHLRFRNRGRSELLDQMSRFQADIVPLIG